MYHLVLAWSNAKRLSDLIKNNAYSVKNSSNHDNGIIRRNTKTRQPMQSPRISIETHVW